MHRDPCIDDLEIVPSRLVYREYDCVSARLPWLLQLLVCVCTTLYTGSSQSHRGRHHEREGEVIDASDAAVLCSRLEKNPLMYIGVYYRICM